MDIIEENDGSLLAIGIIYYCDAYQCFINNAFLLNINSDGKILKQKNYNLANTILYSISKTKDGGYSLLGKINVYSNPSYLWISKIDSFLNIEPPCFYDSKITFSLKELNIIYNDFVLGSSEIPIIINPISLIKNNENLSIEKLCISNLKILNK